MDSKYIVWVDGGYDGYTPYYYDTIEECLKHDTYGRERVITTKVYYQITEIEKK